MKCPDCGSLRHEGECVEYDPRHMDAEANAFAFELLMPETAMRADLAKMGHVDIEDEAAIEKLAKRYKVSRQVMTLRIGQLKGI